MYAISNQHQTAIIEMAVASGLDLLKEDERNPLYSSSYGTGQLINHALHHGVKNHLRHWRKRNE